MNYKDTIHLPKTKFSMKAQLNRLEPETQKKWDEEALYARIRAARAGCEKHILHDGPPYPTGQLHIGTGLNKVLKDFLVRYRTMRGFDAPYVPGWDCHGLPIEVKVLEELGAKRDTVPTYVIRRLCREYAMKYVDVQRRQFKSLGVSGDWDHPYLTIQPEYEVGVLEVFAEMVGKGYVYRELKPVHWCYHCGTVLAEAELEYADVEGPSIFVNLPLAAVQPSEKPNPRDLFGIEDDADLNILIWTTTPWTLPANLAVAVLPHAEYVAVRYAHPDTGRPTVSIMAEALVEHVFGTVLAERIPDYECIKSSHNGRTVTGDCLIDFTYVHPFMDRECPIVPALYVTLEDGTGCVHTAPGHGVEDYGTGIKNGLEILSPVDAAGVFTDEAGPFAGRHIVEADDEIIARLAEDGYMLNSSRSAHSYPHCWRCHKPVIFRSTDQWFVRIDHEGFRGDVLDAVDSAEWVPAWGRERMRSMVADRPDWCISRQKSWGVPIPAFHCEGCDHVHLTRESVLDTARVFAESGADSWFESDSPQPFLDEDFVCPGCGAKSWRKDNDIFDVWFESGSSHHSVVKKRDELRYPADLYLEGTDQYRGWFQLSLLTSLAAWGQAPYKTVLTHGFIVDADGKKMSKSLGNFIGVDEAVEQFRAEVLRLWMLSVDYRDQVSVNPDNISKNMADAYRRVRNTFRFLLGNLADFDPAAHSVDYADLTEIDRWALDTTSRLVEGVTSAFESWDLHKIYTLVHNFCAVEMSSVYLDALKDRLYCAATDGTARRGTQTVLHHILLTLAKLCAPVLVHTTEEVWTYVEHKAPKGESIAPEEAESIHLCRWPEPPAAWRDDALYARWQRILAVRDDVSRAIEALREQKTLSKTLEAKVTLWTGTEPVKAIFAEAREMLTELLMVSEIEVLNEEPVSEVAAFMVCGTNEPGLMLRVEPSDYLKCDRCWNLRPTVGDSTDHPTLCTRCVEAIQA